MDWNSVVGVIGAATLGSLAVAREWTANRGARSRIKQDLELIELLPAASSSSEALRAHVDRNVQRLVESEQHHRRDPTGLLLAAIFTGLTIWTWHRGRLGNDLWFIGTGTATAFVIVGISTSLPKVARDARGRLLKPLAGPTGSEVQGAG